MKVSDERDRIADRSRPVATPQPVSLANGYFPYERYKMPRPGRTGAVSTLDLLRGGRVAAVLPYDPSRGEIVLIRQFRLAAQLANGLGEMVEIVAGRLEPGEDIAETARRECQEEIGVTPAALLEVMHFLPTPGLTDEAITLFLGIVDASRLPETAGAEDENEETRPFLATPDAALAALAAGGLHNGCLIVALQWLGLNRHRLDELLRAAAASGT